MGATREATVSTSPPPVQAVRLFVDRLVVRGSRLFGAAVVDARLRGLGTGMVSGRRRRCLRLGARRLRPFPRRGRCRVASGRRDHFHRIEHPRHAGDSPSARISPGGVGHRSAVRRVGRRRAGRPRRPPHPGGGGRPPVRRASAAGANFGGGGAPPLDGDRGLRPSLRRPALARASRCRRQPVLVRPVENGDGFWRRLGSRPRRADPASYPARAAVGARATNRPAASASRALRAPANGDNAGRLRRHRRLGRSPWSATGAVGEQSHAQRAERRGRRAAETPQRGVARAARTPRRPRRGARRASRPGGARSACRLGARRAGIRAPRQAARLLVAARARQRYRRVARGATPGGF